jgi:LPPG:FO 2-phospho-L-lactate transferase
MNDHARAPMAPGRVLLLSGGVGGAKLAGGLAQLLGPAELTIVVNTADDFHHLGLAISPDLDSVCYMLAGLADEQRGWGRKDETWSCMDSLGAIGGATWFRLGDHDLALHLRRSQLLAAGSRLSEATATLSAAMGIRHQIVPMTDDAVGTIIETAEGDLAFQDYFVRQQCAPVATACRYDGIARAAASGAFLSALRAPDLAGIVIAPSNPFLSIEPILALHGVKDLIRAAGVPVIAVSPLIGGKALKGPAAKLMTELGYASDSDGLAEYYAGVADALVVAAGDLPRAAHPSVRAIAGDILMADAEGRRRVAALCLEILQQLRGVA